MVTGIITATLLLVLFFAAWRINARKKHSMVTAENELTVGGSYQSNTELTGDILMEDDWWKNLNNLQQLHFAIFLCKKALPVWERYVAVSSVNFKTSISGAISNINDNILFITLEEIAQEAKESFPQSDNKKMQHCYSNFVAPVIAIQDGLWVSPYPVKKIFLSVYYILKSIEEQNNNFLGAENLLANAINHALDCIDIAKLFSKVQLNTLLAMYKSNL